MKMSEAMRRGIAMVPEIHGPIYLRSDGQATAACALGTLEIGILGTVKLRVLEGDGFNTGFNNTRRIYDRLAEMWPWTKDYRVAVPGTAATRSIGLEIMMRFEGEQRQSREQIADWLESIEPVEMQVEPAVVVEQEAEVEYAYA